jgi:hypothetical protein
MKPLTYRHRRRFFLLDFFNIEHTRTHVAQNQKRVKGSNGHFVYFYSSKKRRFFVGIIICKTEVFIKSCNMVCKSFSKLYTFHISKRVFCRFFVCIFFLEVKKGLTEKVYKTRFCRYKSIHRGQKPSKMR